MSRKVFGIGLNKTGTTTLGFCLKKLGMRGISCSPKLLSAYRHGQHSIVFSEIEKYEAFEDWPWPLMYKDIFDVYGLDAKYILTRRRTPQIWLESLKRHSLRTRPFRHCRLLAYSYAYPHGAEQYHIDFYEKHLVEVRKFFEVNNATQNLCELCWEDGDGWVQLCEFLGVNPVEEPFPHLNSAPDAQIDPALVKENLIAIRNQVSLLYPELNDEEITDYVRSSIPQHYHSLI